MKKLVIGSLIVLSALSASAASRDVGPYVLGGVGYAHQDGMTTSNAGSVSGSIALGMAFSRDFSVEVGYNQLGSREMVFSSFRMSANWDALTLSMVGSTPINKEHYFIGKLGAARTSASSPNASTNEGFSQTGFVAGLGVDSKINKDLSVRTLVEMYPNYVGSDGTLTNLTVGLKYRF